METCDKFLYWATDMMITFQLVGLCFALPLFLLIIAMLICFLPHMRNSPVPQLNDDDLDKKMERVITTKFSPGDIHAEDAECAICLNRMSSRRNWTLRNCCHTFHRDCLRRWLLEGPHCFTCRTMTEHHQCPVCRQAIDLLELGGIVAESQQSLQPGDIVSVPNSSLVFIYVAESIMLPAEQCTECGELHAMAVQDATADE